MAEASKTIPQVFPVIDFSKGKSASRLDEMIASQGDGPNPGNELRQLLQCVIGVSPFLASCLAREIRWLVQALEGGAQDALEILLGSVLDAGKRAASEAEVMAQLRVAKRRVALLAGVADLGRIWTDGEVTAALSRFASAALTAAFDFLLLSLHGREKIRLGDPENPQDSCGLVVLGMGKFGANELNYSSDIDIVVFFDEASQLELLTDDPVTEFSRMMKQLVKIMQERTGDGYVFRTDLRLRPDPSSTPLVIPVETAINYYEGQGQNWERAAMIKARPVAGDIRAGESFLKELTPFIWRKYLDFAAIQDVHSIKRQIHAHKGHGEIKVKGHNIKLGRGGIREIEFFAQTQQLIAGGRNPQLRQRETIAALNGLARHGWVDASTATEMSQAYWFLRNLEHRLQMIDDAQTHTLPEKPAELPRLAAMMGQTDVKAFTRNVEMVLRLVEGHYASLFEDAPELSTKSGNLVFTGGDDDPGTVATLSRLGFKQPAEAIKLVRQWHVAKIPALQTSTARELLTELMPSLLEAFSGSTDPDGTLYTFDRFVSGLPAGIQLFSILKSNPALNMLLVQILVSAPALANRISRKPHVFDGMLDSGFEEEVPSVDAYRHVLEASLLRITSFEAKLDAARRFCQEMQFQTACRMIGTSHDWKRVSLALSNLAEAVISVMLAIVEEEFANVHGRVPGAQTCILAMGRLGSRELTLESDLDLIFLYHFDEGAERSDGEKPLDPTLYFMRLIKRFITAVTAPTAEGMLYELDFRLRPSGNAGPLATQIDGFLKYQREEAWIWETQSLTRARAIAGDQNLVSRLEAEIPEILPRHASDEKLRSAIFDMRMRIEKEKGDGGTWDMKTARGGLLDIEFIAQWLVLANADGEKMPTSTGDILRETGVDALDRNHLAILVRAFDVFSTVLHLQRICLGKDTQEEDHLRGLEPLLCAALDLPDLSSCEATIKELKHEVRTLFNSLLGS